MKKVTAFLLGLCFAICPMSVFAAGESSSSSVPSEIPKVGVGNFSVVDVLALILAGAILFGLCVLFYKVLTPKNDKHMPPKRRKF